MLYKNNKSVGGIFIGSRAFKTAYKGTRLIWLKVSEYFSCFSNGRWLDEYPWKDEEIWRDE